MILHPASVTFADTPLDNVLTIAVERLAAREVVEFSDLGPHAAYADMPEIRTNIILVRRPSPPELTAVHPGDAGELVFTAAGGTSDAARVRVRVLCAVREVRYDFNDGGAGPGARATPRQMLTFIALSPDGAPDPIVIEPI